MPPGARESGGSGNLYLHRGGGTGQRVASRVKAGAGWNAYDALAGAGDVTGDGLADIVARTPGGTLYLYPGTGVAGAPFTARVDLGNGWNIYSSLIRAGPFGTTVGRGRQPSGCGPAAAPGASAVSVLPAGPAVSAASRASARTWARWRPGRAPSWESWVRQE